MRRLIVALSLVISAPSFATFLLNDVMSLEEQQKTGVANLTPDQRAELELWLNLNFIPKPVTPPPPSVKQAPVTLSENLNNGKQLRLSDGSLYEVSPDDVGLTGFWITPFEVKILPSRDATYPVLLVNTNTGTAVKAKQISPPTITPTP